MFQKKVMEMIYCKAHRPEDLIWHCDTPAKPLQEAVGRRRGSAKALDLGCGAGVFSVYLAKNGFDVTALDFIPKAISMAKASAEAAKVAIQFVGTDLLEWKTSEKFHLILDSGTLHNIDAA